MRQVAALPYRFSNEAGRTIEVMLVTSFRSRRWIIPKGDVDGGMAPHEAAEKEALEEAGVRGRIDKSVTGSFCYNKERNGVSQEMPVDVYALEVTEELARWQEMDDRERRWMSISAAVATVQQPGLQAILQGFRP
jgi:8-oxo-dGTP pyrophosphatase MutT (NUDIX family)